jgi:hypothetical protein
MEHELNNWLREYGLKDGRPRFRLVWSNDIYEHRRGTFRDFTREGIFIREVFETRLTRKYNYIHDRWIFEAFTEDGGSREVPGTEHGDYIPVYIFESGEGKALPVTRKVVEFLIGCCHGRVEKDKIPSQEYLDYREVRDMEESMDDHPSAFSTRAGPQRNSIAYDKGLRNMHGDELHADTDTRSEVGDNSQHVPSGSE